MALRAVVVMLFTSCASFKPVVVVAAGDISAPELDGRQELTAKLVEAQKPDAVLVLGDAQYHDGTLELFQTVYGPTWGRFKDLTYPAPGNHEYRTPDAAGYFAYFGARAGDPSRGYYSFELGAWHVVALNTSDLCQNVSCEAEGEQVKWLEADLAANQKKCVLAYWHYPRFSSGKHGNFDRAAPFWTVLARHRAELVLTGHEHFYERLSPIDGITQITVGTGGAHLAEYADIHPNSVKRQNDTLGVLKLVLGDGRWSAEFVAEDGKTFRDEAWGTCR
ncbi:MAG: alkaline phosphatase [Archangium gephyra]|uniref:Alkaline phosphatase n=1 Tax=Archangium gephyra TaxID=48 RepID=A0A2W5T957_9BACT|nr:MAG: alkaline phosphatase [Archangium gephyra]